jgi:hypothetical protein
MASRNVPLPRFPNPPRVYDPRYFADLIRAFATYQLQIQNPGEGRNTTVVLTDLQVGDQGLEPGTVFRDGAGFLKVALADTANVTGVSATGGVGQITKAP